MAETSLKGKREGQSIVIAAGSIAKRVTLKHRLKKGTKEETAAIKDACILFAVGEVDMGDGRMARCSLTVTMNPVDAAAIGIKLDRPLAGEVKTSKREETTLDSLVAAGVIK